jgi:hypothetical protein
MRTVSVFLAFVLVTCSLFNASIVKAQNRDVNININPNIVSPQAASFGEFGLVPVSLFNGQTQVSIPLYNLEYKDISVPINLNYNSSGHRIDNMPGWVGLGWTLQAGGMVVRQTNGDGADEDEFNYFSSYSQFDDDNWLNKPLGYDAPDEFIFNFNGVTGSFYMNHKGQWQVKSKDGLKLKVEYYVTSNTSLWETSTGLNTAIGASINKFVITTMDGTKYTFGGPHESIEYTRPEGFGQNPSIESVRIVANAWHLTSIETQKAIVKFGYERVINITPKNYTEIYMDPVRGYLNPMFDDATDQNLTRTYANYSSYLTSIDAEKLVKVTFNKSWSDELKVGVREPAHRYYYAQGSDGHPTTGVFSFGLGGAMDNSQGPYFLKLDNIQFKFVGQSHSENISFEYVNNSQERLKLKKVSIFPSSNESNATYDLEYNSQKLPPYLSGQEDHWGFYNGRNFWNGERSHTGAVPDLVAYYNSRETNPTYLQAEMLTKIKYPTGGSTEFIYEPHQYSSIVKHYPFACENLSINKIAGGLRIKKIINTDGVSNVSTVREFFYTKSYLSGGTLSSGVVSGLPRYYESGKMKFGNSMNPYYRFSNDPLNYLNHTNGNHITYSEITEKSADGGYTIYYYTNHDNGYLDRPAFKVTLGSEVASDNPIGLLYNKVFGKLDLERGLLIKKEIFNKDKSILFKEVLEYNDNPARYQEFVRAFQREDRVGSVSYFAHIPIYTFWPYLRNKIEYEYDTNGNIKIKTTGFGYDYPNRLLTRKGSTASDGMPVYTEYRYPVHYSGQTVYDSMMRRNMISSIVETQEWNGYIKNNNVTLGSGALPGNNEFISGKHNSRMDTCPQNTVVIINSQVDSSVYSKSSRDIVDSAHILQSGNLVETGTNISAGDFGVILEPELISTVRNDYGFWNSGLMILPVSVRKSLRNEPLRTVARFEQYDVAGNLLQSRNSKGELISYLWGYGGIYPVAEVNGIENQNIKSLVNQSLLDNTVNDDGLMRNELGRLRPGHYFRCISPGLFKRIWHLLFK